MAEVRSRTAFITGGAHGIGLGIARALASAGAKLASADCDKVGLAQAKAELGASAAVETVELDVRDRKGLAAAADFVERQLGRVSLLINNAGDAGRGDVDDLSFDLWDWSLAINLWGLINGVQTFLPRMLIRLLGGRVVNTASASGLVGRTATMAYCTAKAGSSACPNPLVRSSRGLISALACSVLARSQPRSRPAQPGARR